MSDINTAVKPTLASLQSMIEAQAERITALEAQINKTKTSASVREMTDDDARKILTGELKDASHKTAAEELNLSYGQIYSCRLEYTFKHIHKETREAGVTNPWAKK